MLTHSSSQCHPICHLSAVTVPSSSLINITNVPDEFIIRPEDVERRLMNLKVNKATGSDGIPAWILRDFAPYLAGPICAIFNSSLREGYLPELWKTADVVPLPKWTPPCTIESDLRPILLTPIVSKVLEYFTCGWIKKAITPSINPNQYGAISGSSTTHALVDMMHYIYSSVDKPGHHVRSLLLDYSKAFDSVNHHIVLQKLDEAGCPPLLTRWAASFLLQRKQRVRVGDHYSPLVSLNGGTPQGTLFGPLSFIVHLGDFNTPAPVDHIYVDDTTISSESDDPADQCMQRSADYSVQWAQDNDMRLNALKTKELVFSFAKKPTHFDPM